MKSTLLTRCWWQCELNDEVSLSYVSQIRGDDEDGDVAKTIVIH